MFARIDQNSQKDEIVQLIFGIIRRVHDELHKSEAISDSLYSPLQIHAIRYIKERGNPPMKDLADFLYVTPPSATSLIDGLVDAGIIKRTLDKKDRRFIRLTITKKGEKELKKGSERLAGQMQKVFSVLTPTERQQLVHIYSKINKHFKTIKFKKYDEII